MIRRDYKEEEDCEEEGDLSSKGIVRNMGHGEEEGDEGEEHIAALLCALCRCGGFVYPSEVSAPSPQKSSSL